MNKFEDELKYAQKATSNEFLSWLQNVSYELIKQKEYSYGQEFFRSQQNLYELIFKSNGILNNSFRTTQQRYGSIEDTFFFIKLLNILSPEEMSFYSALPSEYPYHSVSLDVLPAHIQLYFKDPSLANMNQQFQAFQDIFQENIQVEKSQLKFCVSAKMIVLDFIYQMGAVNFKGQCFVCDRQQFKNCQDCALNKCKRKVQHLRTTYQNSSTPQSHTQFLLDEFQNYMYTKNQRKQLNIKPPDKTIVDFHFSIDDLYFYKKYTLYEHLYVNKLFELNLTIDQQKLLYKIKPSSIVLDTQMMLIYLTIYFNSLYGTDLETIYQQFKPFLRNSDIFNKSSQFIYQNRSFFFECGRQKQQITYQQGLFKFFQHSFEVYPNERQCNQITLYSHIAAYVLFLKWQFINKEQSIYNQALIFDQALSSCVASQNQILGQLQKKRVNSYKGSNPLTKFIVNELLPLYQVCKNKFGDCPQTVLFKYFKPHLIEQRFSQFEYRLDSQMRELDPQRNLMKNSIRLYYPFYTKLLITIFQCLSNLNYLNDSEYQGLIHLFAFCESNDQNSFFCDSLKFIKQKPFQIPAYQEVKNFCDMYVKNSDEGEFLIIENKDTKKFVTQAIELLMSYQQRIGIKNDKTVEFLGSYFNIQTSKINAIPIKNISPQQSLGRLSKSRIVINEWKAPLRDFEIYVFFIIMWYFSLGLDKLKGLPQSEVPQTQWPRRFASPINLFIVSIIIYGLFKIAFMFI
ncbi:unnamed protein product (macronuclear) [Paramecium tetraurelia]|uniref:Uncharacterized protein n=1 Tax=Paramecium tetraurelia TaxID=5888 RepID=A0CL04_PARTE|nr:uncharacterized protein GSPATT00008018001 [Paramecium tetraurelia]CAK71471.1 unnamed protein product [Paramecium tetraurelia]|eukprot:XP_001438868.1 hypothetical protein (macronuclear) [Paramecium tetraurelia strain d4-2]